jgi:hypothetical protein
MLNMDNYEAKRTVLAFLGSGDGKGGYDGWRYQDVERAIAFFTAQAEAYAVLASAFRAQDEEQRAYEVRQ